MYISRCGSNLSTSDWNQYQTTMGWNPFLFSDYWLSRNHATTIQQVKIKHCNMFLLDNWWLKKKNNTKHQMPAEFFVTTNNFCYFWISVQCLVFSHRPIKWKEHISTRNHLVSIKHFYICSNNNNSSDRFKSRWYWIGTHDL